MHDDRNDARKVAISKRLGGWGPIPHGEPYKLLPTVKRRALEAAIALDNPETDRAHDRFDALIDAQILISYGHFHGYDRHDVREDRIAACIDAVEAWQPGADNHRYCQRLRAALVRSPEEA